MNWPIGIFIDNLRMETPDAMRAAAAIGVRAIQAGGIDKPGKMALSTRMSAQSRREYKAFAGDLGLEILALCGGGNFKIAEETQARVEETLRVLDLAADLGARIVSAHIGPIPMEPAHPRYQRMLGACRRVAAHAASMGACFAIETGPEASCVLKMFLEDIASPGIGVNFDPANLVMITGEDPAKAARRLGGDIVHTHVKDGVMNRFVGTDIAYGLSPDPDNLKPGSRTQTPVGEGGVNWKEYLAALESIRYRGCLTIEREGGDDREAEIRRAYQTLRGYLEGRF